MATLKACFLLLTVAVALTSAHSRGGGRLRGLFSHSAAVATEAPKTVPSQVQSASASFTTPAPSFTSVSGSAAPAASTLASSYSYGQSSSVCRTISPAEAAFDANTDILATNWTAFGQSSNFYRMANELSSSGDLSSFYSALSSSEKQGKQKGKSGASRAAIQASLAAAEASSQASSSSSSSSSSSKKSSHSSQTITETIIHSNGTRTVKTSKSSKNSQSGGGSGSDSKNGSGSENGSGSSSNSSESGSASSAGGGKLRMSGPLNDRFETEDQSSRSIEDIKRQIASHLFALHSLIESLKIKQTLSCYSHRASAEIAQQQLQLAALNLVTSCYEPTLTEKQETRATRAPTTTTTTTHRPEKLLERKTQLKVNPNVMDVLHSGILDGVIAD